MKRYLKISSAQIYMKRISHKSKYHTCQSHFDLDINSNEKKKRKKEKYFKSESLGKKCASLHQTKKKKKKKKKPAIIFELIRDVRMSAKNKNSSLGNRGGMINNGRPNVKISQGQPLGCLLSIYVVVNVYQPVYGAGRSRGLLTQRVAVS